jgi:hypothetical protein
MVNMVGMLIQTNKELITFLPSLNTMLTMLTMQSVMGGWLHNIYMHLNPNCVFKLTHIFK